MFLSIRDDMIRQCGFGSIAEGLKSLELERVELAIDRDFRCLPLLPIADRSHLELDDPADVSLLQSHGSSCQIKVCCLLLGNNFNAPDIERELAWMVKVIQIAESLSVRVIRIDAIMRGERDLDFAARTAIVAEGIRTILDRTAGSSVQLGIENHGFQGNDPAFLTKLIQSVESPRLGLTMDTANFYWAGHPLGHVYEILERLAPYVKHTHVKNICYPAELRETPREMGFAYAKYCCPVAAGDIDHGRVVGYLQANHYDGDLCIEDESLGKYDPRVRRSNLKAAVDHLRALVNANR